jgi:integral membrane protein
MLRNPIGRLRAVALVEGVSFLVLLLVAMPLKYAAGMPAAVKVVGWAHGVLFVLFLVALLQALEAKLPLSRAFGAFVASVLPFGTFVYDRKLRDDERALTGQAT